MVIWVGLSTENWNVHGDLDWSVHVELVLKVHGELDLTVHVELVWNVDGELECPRRIVERTSLSIENFYRIMYFGAHCLVFFLRMPYTLNHVCPLRKNRHASP